MAKTLLVDADVLRYQIAFGNQDDIDWGDGEIHHRLTPEKASMEAEGFITGLKEKFKTDDLVIVLSGKENFRVQWDETYKANRKDKEKPILWQLVSDYLEWGDHGHPVISQEPLEGDDILGILHTGKHKDKSIIVTIDKDMYTVPGLIYRWSDANARILGITPEDAAYFHLTQVLTGDRVDNYKGCPGIGEKRADKIRAEATSVLHYWDLIVEVYGHKGLTADDAIHQARLAFILRDGWFNRDTGEIRKWTPEQLEGL